MCAKKICGFIWWHLLCPGLMHLVVDEKYQGNILYHYRIQSTGCHLVGVFRPFCSKKKSNVRIVATNMFHNFTRVFHRGILMKGNATSHSGYQAASAPPVQPDAERCGEWQQDILHHFGALCRFCVCIILEYSFFFIGYTVILHR